MIKHIVILQNKPEDFKVFLHCLQDRIKEHYIFHLVTDTRHYDVSNILYEMAMEAGIRFKQYDGGAQLEEIMKKYSFGGWFKNYHKSCKLILPILFNDLGKFLYMDDDCLILNDPEPFWNFDYASGRETVFARITSKPRWEAYRNIVRNPKVTQEFYNRNQLNSGTFMYACKNVDRYITLMKGYSNSDFFKREFAKGRFILDEEILSFWFIEVGNKFVPSNFVTIRNGKFTYRTLMNKTPLVYHYAVKDEYTPDYRDYFGSCICLRGAVMSGFDGALDFQQREVSVIPTFKKEMRGRMKNET